MNILSLKAKNIKNITFFTDNVVTKLIHLNFLIYKVEALKCRQCCVVEVINLNNNGCRFSVHSFYKISSNKAGQQRTSF